MSIADLSIYFQPIDSKLKSKQGTLSQEIEIYQTEFPDIKKNSIVLLDCPEFRNSPYKTDGVAKEEFRSYLYNMSYAANWSFSIYDLGTIQPGKTVEDTYFAIRSVITTLVKHDCMPIVIGGSQDLTYSVYQGFQQLEQTVNITSVDSRLDLGNPEEKLNAENYISHILTSRPCTLFNYSIIGTQQPFLSKEDVQLMDKLYFDYCRLGELIADFKKAEPFIRNADILSVDLTALKAIDGRYLLYDNPNGISPETICQIARYSGISDKLSTFIIANYHPGHTSNVMNHLVAQMIWYFMDGFGARYGDFPVSSVKNYLKFTVKIMDMAEEVIFYKSEKSERWWMEVPYPKKKELDFSRQTIVPCNYEDYLKAMENDLPDLWWRTYQKLL